MHELHKPTQMSHIYAHIHTHLHTYTCVYIYIYCYMHTHIHTGQYPQINDDLVNSHHLLLCCMDMLFCAAVEGKRRDLLNPDCSFLPEDFSSSTFTPSEERMCVLTELCTKYGGRCGVWVCPFTYVRFGPSQLCCLGSSVVECSVLSVECRGFESHPRQLIFHRKSDCLGCTVLLCLVVCLTLLASSFLPSLTCIHL